MKSDAKEPSGGFTLIELISVIVIGAFLVLVILLLPAMARGRARGSRINCVNNVKQVALGFRQWALDNNDKFPMQVSTNSGGTMELLSKGAVYPHFQVMSNELNTPKILLCPEDSKRNYATRFWTNFSDTNISYFIGADADQTNAFLFLSGDDNLQVAGKPCKPGLAVVSTNTVLSWAKARHENQGNVAMTDGSVQILSDSRLMQALVATGQATNRFLFP
ncbi:MAG: type II secretion system protein [Verrucomicrobia bacterium]|nr:MAG: type II secretion system protein [Verrucomicrobiota bacterium]